MKKRQDQFSEALRMGLIVFFFGIMILGFFLMYKQRTSALRAPQIETTVLEKHDKENGKVNQITPPSER